MSNWVNNPDFIRFMYVIQVLGAIVMSKILHQNMLIKKRKIMLDTLKEDLEMEVKPWI